MIITYNLSAVEDTTALANKLKSSSGKERINILIELANSLKATSPQKTIDYSNQAISLSRQSNDKRSEGLSLLALGNGLDNIGDYLKALENMQYSLQIFKNIADNNLMSKAFIEIGMVYNRYSNFPKALENFKYAAQIVEKNGNKKDKLLVYHSIGKIYNDMTKLDDALQYFNVSLKLAQEMNDLGYVSMLYNDIGNTYRAKKEDKKALEYYFNSLKLKEKIGDKAGLAFSYYNIGGIYYLRRNDEVLEFFLKSIKFNEEMGDQKGIAEAYKYVGKIYLALGNTKSSIDALLKSYNLSNDNNFKEIKFEVAQYLSEAYTEAKNTTKALEFLRIHHALSETITSETSQKKLFAIEATNNMDKQDTEFENLRHRNEIIRDKEQKALIFMSVIIFLLLIAIVILVWTYKLKRRTTIQLRNKNQQIESAYEMLIKSERELKMLHITKDKYFDLIAHDLKGPVGALANMNDMLIEHYDSFSKDEMISSLKDQRKQTKQLYSMLDSLLQWTRLKTGNINFNPEQVDINYITQNSVALLGILAENKGLSVEMNLPANNQVYADAGMLSTVISNIFSNAIKYSEKGGKIKISSSNHNDDTLISVEDNGVGISTEDMTKLFKIDETLNNPGTAGETGAGMGLILCKELIEMNQGTISVDSKLGIGSTFTFTIPKTNSHLKAS
jgi:signal transduction histidine kinase